METDLNVVLMTTADIPKTCVDAWNTVEGWESDGDEDELLFVFYTEHVDALSSTDRDFKMTKHSWLKCFLTVYIHKKG